MRLDPIPVRPPFPWQALREYLAHRLIPRIERIEDGAYIRQVENGIVTVTYEEQRGYLLADVEGSVDAYVVRSNIAKLFDVDFEFKPIEDHLHEFPLFGSRLGNVPGMRPLGAWSPFELCVRTILGQQVTVAAARTLMSRWVERCGAITPSCVLGADLTNIGMPAKRVEFVQALARAVLERRVDFEAPWGEIDTSLQTLPGFGPWTRAYLAIRLGREPDELPASDLGLIRAAKVNSAKELARLAEAWRPYRSYAATYLWAVPEDIRG